MALNYLIAAVIHRQRPQNYVACFKWSWCLSWFGWNLSLVMNQAPKCMYETRSKIHVRNKAHNICIFGMLIPVFTKNITFPSWDIFISINRSSTWLSHKLYHIKELTSFSSYCASGTCCNYYVEVFGCTD